MGQSIRITQRQIKRSQQPDRAAPKPPSTRSTGLLLSFGGTPQIQIGEIGIMADEDTDEQLTQGKQEGSKISVNYDQPLPHERESRGWTQEQKVEGGLIAFFASLIRGAGKLIRVSAKALVPGILAAALLPFFGPVLTIGFSFSLAAAVALIQDKLKPIVLSG